jgi:hypothetical protein
MPLRDHFRPPLDDMRHWEGFHATWPVMIVALLKRHLPRPFFAEPRVHPASSAEIDVATFENEQPDILATGNGNGTGGVATAVWAPPQPTLTVVADFPAQAEYEVRVYDEKRRSRLVASVEIVSPANKDRPELRRVFVAKCAALLHERVSVVIVDVVTNRNSNLYHDLLELICQSDPGQNGDIHLYSAACRMTKPDKDWNLQAWSQPLELGRPLPTVPLWLADNLAVPLELEASYEQSCGILDIP